MQKTVIFLVSAGLLAAGTAWPQTPNSQSRDEINLGVQAYRNNRYADAVEHFKTAVMLDPSNKAADLYLASAYMIQWVPGADSPDNGRIYELAKQEFEQVLQKDPTNSQALASLASMAYNSASSGTAEQKAAALEEAKKWNERRIEVDPKDPEPYYYLGVISWSQAFAPIQTARIKAGMRPEQPGPIEDANVRGDLEGTYGRTIQDGIAALTKCLEIDKQNEDAMSYMNLLLREKAPLEESQDAAQTDIAQAEEWSNKSLETKKLKAARPQR